MKIEKVLDLSIKKAETGESKANKCFVIGDRCYENYVDNEAWDNFVAEMKVEFKEQYSNGSGDELGIKKASKFPPKMASYGSSSRMIYLLSKNIPNFIFEKKLKTTIGGVANMDGYLHLNNEHVYIEAKCREPYYSKSFTIDRAYEKLYRYLNDREDIDFNCEIKIVSDKKMEVKFSSNGVQIIRFDVKQAICHLLAIATEQLTRFTNEKTKFLYLLYNPKKIEIVNSQCQQTIFSIYEKEVLEFNSIAFCQLFSGIVDYLYKEEGGFIVALNGTKAIAQNFSYALCDQETYANYVK